MATGSNNIGGSGIKNSGPSVRARLSTSMEPTGLAGTSWASFFDSKYSWNSARWTRPSSGYRSNRMANTFESGSTSSAASSCSSSLRGQSPHSYTIPTTATTLRSSERASSAVTRPLNETTQIRPNSRYGTSFHNSPLTNFNGSSSSSTGATTRTSHSANGALSPRQEPLQRTSYPYRTTIGSINQSRAALVDMRQSLRPVKRQIVTDYKSVPRSSALASTASTSAPLNLFTNVQIRTGSAHQSALSPVSPFPKCVSPPSMSQSSSTVTSPITTPITIAARPIPKSERPWRQKLADAQRLREAQADRSFGQHIPLDPYDTASRILAARSARRASIEQQQTQTQKQQNNEQQLEKEIAALKCYVSEPGALDKNATVAKFRQRMAEGQITASLTSPTGSGNASNATSSSNPSTTSTFNASSLLSRMPSLSRRSTTSVTKENLQEARSSSKDRPLSLIETPFGQRRLSVVKEATVAEMRPEDVSPSSTAKTVPEVDSSLIKGMKKKESPKTQRKMAAAKDEAGGVNSTRPGSRASTTSTISTTTPASQIVKTTPKDANKSEEKKNGKTTPLLSKRKKRDSGGEKNKLETKDEKNLKPTVEKKKSEEDEKTFNAVVQFKPQSMLRRKISTEEDGGKKKEPLLKTTPKWRKPLLERKISKEESPKPVPGTWERTSKERFISQNKHLIRKTLSEGTVHTQKVRPLVRVSSARLKATTEDNQSLRSLTNAVKAKGSPTAAVLKMIKSIAKPKQRICAVAVVDKQFANKRTLRLGVRKTFMLKGVPQKLCTQLRCKSAQLLASTVRFNIVWKEQKKTANVTILLADWERVVSHLIREPSKKQQRTQPKSPLKRIQQELNKENMNGSGTGRPIIIGGKQQQTNGQKQKQIPSSTRQQQFPVGASLVAAAAGTITAAVAALSTGQAAQQQQKVPNRQSKATSQIQLPQPLQKIPQLGEVPLILPDRSVLEQFVQTKRDALDRLHEEAEGILEQTRGPPPASNLQLPATAPATETVSLPGSKRNSQMLVTVMPPTTDAQLPQSLSNSFHAAVQATAADLHAQQQKMAQPVTMARLRRPQPEIKATLSTQTVQSFEKPKSLFEEQMQRQAIHLQQKAVRQSLHEPSVAERQAAAAGMRRRSAAGEHADVAQSFVTQAQKPFQSEQRYAAHIPLSGRQSTASIESANSSTIDAATRQLDQMIDQARYKHNQQRNKFKEAIDYLDHIFEDFQRESDLRQPPAKKPAPPPHQMKPAGTSPILVEPEPSSQIEPVQATFRAGNVKSAKEAFEKVAAAIASEKKTTTSSSGAAKLKKQTSAPAAQQQKSSTAIQRPEPFPVIVQPPSTTTVNDSQQQEEASGEVEIAETIVLPSKNTADRLDFTRNWLASGGDVRIWADSSPRKGDQLLGQPKGPEDECYDSDEHSLGSCSAEVAAINAVNERKQQQRQKLSKTMSMGAGTANGAAKKKGGATALSHHQSLKNGTANGQQTQLRQKQPPSSSSTTIVGSVPPPQIAAPAPPSQTTAVSRPQPYRPQPQLGLLPPALAASGQMHKVPSIEQLRLRASQERACSQDYQSMGSSIHSQEGGFRPQATYLSTHSLQRLGVGSGIGGAFHSYTPTMLPTHQQHQFQPNLHGQYPNNQQSAAQQLHQLKGSIQSLPDSALCTAPNSTAQMMGSTAAGMPNLNSNNYSQSTQHNQSNTSNHRQQHQFATLARMDINNKQKAQKSTQQIQKQSPPQQYSLRGGGGNPPAIPAHQSSQHRNAPPPPALSNEHALAIDALVAELELNTDSVQTTAEKRRSFPTMQTELALSKANQQAENEANAGGGGETQRHRRQQNGGGSMSARTATRTERRPLEEISEYIQKGVGQRKQSGGGGNRFETINQEKLSPSKVDVMARKFDHQHGRNGHGTAAKQGGQICFTSGGPAIEPSSTMTPNNWAARRAATTGRRMGADEAVGKMVNGIDGDSCVIHSTGGGGSKATITGGGDVQQQQLRQPQPPNSHSAYSSSSYQSSPRIVRGTRAGTKLGAAAPPPSLLLAEKHRGNTPTVDDDLVAAEDCNGNGINGFYENIQRQRLRPSPGYYSGAVADDCSSISSQPGSAVLPPTASSGGKGAGAKIGQLIRKLGSVGSGGSGKPPFSAASMVSLNRVSNEPLGNGRSGGTIGGDGMLTKSNSLSGEPWKCQVLAQQNGSRDPLSEEDKPQHNNGIGNRLKQTIFGGMVRRRVPI